MVVYPIDKLPFSLRVSTEVIMRIISFLALPFTMLFGFWNAAVMRPPVEPVRVELLLDSLLKMGNPERGLTKLVEDSLRPSEERLKAATILSALYNRRENPAKALLVLFYAERETGVAWDPEQNLIAAEAYSRLGRSDWALTHLGRIPKESDLSEVAHTLEIFEQLSAVTDKDSIVEVRSDFERVLERYSDPAAILLAVEGLGLSYLAKATPESIDTAAGYFSLIADEYRKQDLYMPYIERLAPFSLYWSGISAGLCGDGWTALSAWERIFKEHPQSRFWEEASVRYASLMVRRWMPDSATLIIEKLLAATSDTHRIYEARMLKASAHGLKERYDLAAEEFAGLLRVIPPGDTLRVLAYAGMVEALVQYSRSVYEADSIAPRLERLGLSGYNPVALPRICVEIGERYIAERRLPEADSFLDRALGFYPDMGVETQAQLDLAWISLAWGHWDKAITHYERSLELMDRLGIKFSGLADVRFNIGLAYLERSRCTPNGNGKADFTMARTCFRDALALDPRGETGQLARKKLEEMQ